MLNSARFTIDCQAPGSLIGRPGRISWSLPKAMFDPQNEIDPTIAPNSSKISVRTGKNPGAK